MSEPLSTEEAIERLEGLDPDWDLSGPFPDLEDEDER